MENKGRYINMEGGGGIFKGLLVRVVVLLHLVYYQSFIFFMAQAN